VTLRLPSPLELQQSLLRNPREPRHPKRKDERRRTNPSSHAKESLTRPRRVMCLSRYEDVKV